MQLYYLLSRTSACKPAASKLRSLRCQWPHRPSRCNMKCNRLKTYGADLEWRGLRIYACVIITFTSNTAWISNEQAKSPVNLQCLNTPTMFTIAACAFASCLRNTACRRPPHAPSPQPRLARHCTTIAAAAWHICSGYSCESSYVQCLCPKQGINAEA